MIIRIYIDMFKFERHRIDKIPQDRIIAELLKVAEANQYCEFRQKDFEALANISRHPVITTFGSWPAALQKLRELLRLQGKELKPRSRVRISDVDLFHRNATDLVIIWPSPFAL